MEFSLPFHGKPWRVETSKLLFFIGIITCAAFAVQIFLTPYENVFHAVFLVNNAPAGDSSLDISVMDIFMPIYDSTMASTPSENYTETSDPAKVSQKSIKTMLAEMIPSNNRMKRTWMKMPPNRITSISAMSRLLLKNLASSNSMRPQWSSEQDQDILAVKSEIENAPVLKNDKDLYAPIYRNLSTFRRSYELMEEILKVYIYKEGEKPFFHDPVLEGVYASEGWFMKQMEENKRFVVQDPTKAHLFYLPFSSERIRYSSLFDRKIGSKTNMIMCLSDYLDIIKAKYPFWNRTGGADHFFTACHDWVLIDRVLIDRHVEYSDSPTNIDMENETILDTPKLEEQEQQGLVTPTTQIEETQERTIEQVPKENQHEERDEQVMVDDNKDTEEFSDKQIQNQNNQETESGEPAEPNAEGEDETTMKPTIHEKLAGSNGENSEASKPFKMKFKQVKELEQEVQDVATPQKLKFKERDNSKGKKETQAYNDVIEETASKLAEKKKNKVLALAGDTQRKWSC